MKFYRDDEPGECGQPCEHKGCDSICTEPVGHQDYFLPNGTVLKHMHYATDTDNWHTWPSRRGKPLRTRIIIPADDDDDTPPF